MVPGGSPSSILNSRAEISLRSIPATVLLCMGAFSFSLLFYSCGNAPLEFLLHQVQDSRQPCIRRRLEAERLGAIPAQRHERGKLGVNPLHQGTQIQSLGQFSIVDLCNPAAKCLCVHGCLHRSTMLNWPSDCI